MEVDEVEMSSSQLLDPPSPIKEGIFDVYEEAALFLNDGHRGTPFSEYLKRQNATTLLPIKPFIPKAKPNGKYGAWIPLFVTFFQQPDFHICTGEEEEGFVFVKPSFLAVYNDLLTDFLSRLTKESNL